MEDRIYCVYIMTNKNHTVLYTGMTNELEVRVWCHKTKIDKRSFTARYNCNKLVYYAETNDPWVAINEEKRIKAGSRQKKIDLINSMNPEWKDLSDGWYE